MCLEERLKKMLKMIMKNLWKVRHFSLERSRGDEPHLSVLQCAGCLVNAVNGGVMVVWRKNNTAQEHFNDIWWY